MVIKSALPPGRVIQTGIISLSVIDIGCTYRPLIRAFPAVVRNNDLFRPVGIYYLKLHQQGKMRTIGIAVPFERKIAPVPAVTQEGSHGILSFCQKRGHVVHLVLQPFMVTGEPRCKKLIPHPLPVEPQLIQSVCRSIQTGSFYLFLQGELLTETLCGLRTGGVLRHCRDDPGCFPVCRLQQSGLPPCRPAPGGAVAMVIPHTHLPPYPLTGFEGRSAVRHIDRPVAADPACRPQKFIFFLQVLFYRSHTQLISRLKDIPPFSGQLPRQTRPGIIHPQRIHFVFAGKMYHLQHRLAPHRQEHDGQQKKHDRD